MLSVRNQRTLAGPAVVEGIGYWSGQDVSVEFRPGAPESGIAFVRRDLPGCPRIPATIECRSDMPRRTTLCRAGAGVGMVEHIMAALAGLHVDNCEVWADQPEMPGCDGSALPFVEAILGAGIVEQDAPREQYVVQNVFRLGTEDAWLEVRPAGGEKTILRYDLDYGIGNPIGRQSLETVLAPRFFHLNLAPARTFMLEIEADALRAQGLGQRATPRDLLVFGADGPIDNRLRFPDECVRHKLLDLVGDLALFGADLVGRFHAYRSGHRLNAEMVTALRRLKATPLRVVRSA